MNSNRRQVWPHHILDIWDSIWIQRPGGLGGSSAGEFGISLVILMKPFKRSSPLEGLFWGLVDVSVSTKLKGIVLASDRYGESSQGTQTFLFHPWSWVFSPRNSAALSSWTTSFWFSSLYEPSPLSRVLTGQTACRPLPRSGRHTSPWTCISEVGGTASVVATFGFRFAGPWALHRTPS